MCSSRRILSLLLILRPCLVRWDILTDVYSWHRIPLMANAFRSFVGCMQGLGTTSCITSAVIILRTVGLSITDTFGHKFLSSLGKMESIATTILPGDWSMSKLSAVDIPTLYPIWIRMCSVACTSCPGVVYFWGPPLIELHGAPIASILPPPLPLLGLG